MPLEFTIVVSNLSGSKSGETSKEARYSKEGLSFKLPYSSYNTPSLRMQITCWLRWSQSPSSTHCETVAYSRLESVSLPRNVMIQEYGVVR